MTNEIDRIGREVHFRLRFGHELLIVSHGKTPRQSCPDLVHALPQFSQRAAHTAVPNRLPIPAVTAIASAPLNAARIAPMMVRAPPARAASAPRIASNTTDAPAPRESDAYPERRQRPAAAWPLRLRSWRPMQVPPAFESTCPSSPALLLRSTRLRVHRSVPLSQGGEGGLRVGRQADPHWLEPECKALAFSRGYFTTCRNDQIVRLVHCRHHALSGCNPAQNILQHREHEVGLALGKIQRRHEAQQIGSRRIQQQAVVARDFHHIRRDIAL